MSHRTTRRTFVKGVAAGSVAMPLYLPTVSRAAPTSRRVNIAGIGVDGKGWSDIDCVSKGHNVVAICDVDKTRMTKAREKWPDAKVYTDWRKVLEQKDIDAVTVSTPDHMHAPIALSAMQLGKHVYVQKPMTHTVAEARRMRRAANHYGVVTQMGNQGHSGVNCRSVVKLVRGGAIGKVREAHAWSNRPIWPQGMAVRPDRTDPVPDVLNWDVWLGVAPKRPFVDGVYHPFKWRGWADFGTGALGDMGCHIIDPVFWSLDLTAPTHVRADAARPSAESFPKAATVHWDFPGTVYTADKTIRLTWYDGGRLPSRDLVPLSKNQQIPNNGCLLVGTKGTLLCRHGGAPQLLPAADFADYRRPRLRPFDHYTQWSNAILGRDKTTSHFDYAGPLTETVLLGNVAMRFGGETLEWDAANLRITNVTAANRYLRTDYRTGWQLAGLT